MIAGLDYEQFLQVFAPQKRAIWQQNRFRAIWEKAPNLISCDADEGLELEAKVMVEALELIREITRATHAKIKESCIQFSEHTYLLTISGFGSDVSSKVLGAIGDLFRFNSGKQVLKMAG